MGGFFLTENPIPYSLVNKNDYGIRTTVLIMALREETIILDQKGIDDNLQSLVGQISEKEKEGGVFSFVGIHTRGIPLARRLAKLLKRDPDQIGTLDINLYRDDLSTVSDMPIVRQTKIPFSIDGVRLLLIDDVLFTGRTIRAALDALTDLGRPKKIELLVLIDRGGRELPIQADLCGKILEVKSGEFVRVRLQEVDGVEKVVVVKKE